MNDSVWRGGGGAGGGGGGGSDGGDEEEEGDEEGEDGEVEVDDLVQGKDAGEMAI